MHLADVPDLQARLPFATDRAGHLRTQPGHQGEQIAAAVAATEAAAVAVGGVVGSLADSVLGASVQSRRRCDACNAWTERQVHRCGGATSHARGFAWLTNDSVNFCATAVGGAVAWGVAALLA